MVKSEVEIDKREILANIQEQAIGKHRQSTSNKISFSIGGDILLIRFDQNLSTPIRIDDVFLKIDFSSFIRQFNDLFSSILLQNSDATCCSSKTQKKPNH